MKPNKSHYSRIPTIGITNTHGSIVIHWYYAITELWQNSVSACQMRVKVQPGLPCLSAGAFFVAWILSGPVSAAPFLPIILYVACATDLGLLYKGQCTAQWPCLDWCSLTQPAVIIYCSVTLPVHSSPRIETKIGEDWSICIISLLFLLDELSPTRI